MSDGLGVTVELFGELRLGVGNSAPVRIESSRARSVIGYVIVHGDLPHARQQVAFAVWPDSSEAQARTNLRKVLHSLRRDHPTIEGFLDVGPRTLRWRRELTGLVDIDEFEGALAEAEQGTGADDRIDALTRVEALYTGDLMVGCWDEWLVDHRERYRDLRLLGLRRLVDALDEAGRPNDAVRYARELLRAEPLQESAYRLLMGLYRATGDRAGAARVYHQCASTLRDELGVDPAPETTAEYHRLTSARPAAAPAAPAGPAGPSRGQTLVGRADEWDRLTALWPDGDVGSARLVLVTGEPGIGKTRLADTFGSWCARRGAAVGRARSFPAEGDLGFGLVISWLRSADFQDSLSHVTGSDRDLLTRLLPELGDGAELLLDYSEQRRRLFDVVTRVLAATGDRPTVLIADDAQWADEQSVQAMQHLVRRDPLARLLVVATVRREDLADAAAINAVAAGLASVDQLTEIALGRLSRTETEALARDLVDFDLTDRSIDRLHADSEGNPLFVVESIRAGWRPDRADAPLSPKLRGVIATRVAQLAPPTREVLDLAVTVGREFAVSLVREASILDDVAMVQALDELWRRGFIREYSTDAYDFTHGKIREAVYEGFSPAVRRSNHRRIAQAHLVVDAGSLDSVSGRLAYHCDHGGLADDAVTWYLRAASRAQRLYANEEAVRLLDRALEVAATLADDRRPRRELEVLSALPTPLALVESFTSERTVETQQRAVDLATEVGIDPQPSVLRSLALVRLCQNQFDETASIGRRLRAQADTAGDENLMIEAEYLIGVAAFWDGAFDTARAQFELVVNDFPPARRSEHLVRFGQDSQIVCLSRLANTLRFLGHVDDAIETRRAAVARAKALGHPWTLSLTLIFASMLAVDLDEREPLQDFARTLAGIEVHTRPNRLHTQAIVGTAEAFAGRSTDGIAKVRAAIDECGPVNPAPGFRPTMWRLLVAAHRAGGDPVGLDEACAAALRIDGSRIWWPDIERARGADAGLGD